MKVTYEGTSMQEVLEASRAMSFELAAEPGAPHACAQCGAPIPPNKGACAFCGKGTRTTASVLSPLPPAPLDTQAPIESRPVTTADRLLDAMAELSLGFWKRLAVYPILLMVLGAGCTCRGLSRSSALTLGALALLGFLGVWACGSARPRARRG